MNNSRPFKLRADDYNKLKDLHSKLESIEGKVKLIDIPGRWLNSTKVWNQTLEDSVKRAEQRLRSFKK